MFLESRISRERRQQPSFMAVFADALPLNLEIPSNWITSQVGDPPLKLYAVVCRIGMKVR